MGGFIVQFRGLRYWRAGPIRWWRLPNLADEPKALSGDCPHQALLIAAVADCLADRIDVAGHGRFGDDASAPHRVQQIMLADDAFVVPHQIDQQVEDLRSDRNRLGLPGELTPVSVEHAVSE